MICALAITLNKLYISSKMKNSLVIPISLHCTDEVPCNVTALIDSGALESFVDYRVAEQWNLPTQNLKYAREIVNVDGTENKQGQITKACILRVC